MPFIPDAKTKTNVTPSKTFIPDRTSSSPVSSPEEHQSQLAYRASEIKRLLLERGKNIQESFNRGAQATSSGNLSGQNPAETALQTVGQVAGGIGDVIGQGLEAITPKFIKSGVKNTINKVAQSGVGQEVAQELSSFSQKNPRAAANIGAVTNIASMLPIGKGLGIAGEKAMSLGGKAIGGAGGMVGRQAAKQAEQRAINALTITEDYLTKKGGQTILGKVGSEIKPGGFFKKAGTKIVPNENVIKIVQPYINSSNPIKNIQNIASNIIKKDELVGEGLRNNNIMFNPNELKTTLKTGLKDVTDIYAAEKTVNRLKDSVIEDVLSRVKTNTLEDLWMARKEFDQVIKNKLRAFSGSPTLRKEISERTRNIVQDFIDKKIPLGGFQYKQTMSEMRAMYQALDVLKVKGQKILGTNGIERFMEKVMSPITSPIGKIIKRSIFK